MDSFANKTAAPCQSVWAAALIEVCVIIPDVVWDSFDADVSLGREHVTVWSTLKSQWAD